MYYSSAAIRTRPLRNAVLAGALVAALANSACARRPASLDVSLDRLTDQRHYRVKIASETDPVPLSRVHQWSVQVMSADGKPVAGATLRVDGGMPEHRHGLPTAPRVEETAVPGSYRIRGMKFSMTGWWVLKLDIREPGGRADKTTFNVVL